MVRQSDCHTLDQQLYLCHIEEITILSTANSWKSCPTLDNPVDLLTWCITSQEHKFGLIYNHIFNMLNFHLVTMVNYMYYKKMYITK